MHCEACGWANAAGNRFCGRCGTAFPVGCPSCGGTVPAGQPFCGQCGRAMSSATESPEIDPSGPSATTISELRWASVLFVDLVEYTSLTQGWDAEEIRELLTGYYEVASTIVQRYGGMVEKFIGDAVVAVWGARSSREDDAPRAVRAALEIVAGVTAYGEVRRLPGLAARAGVVTGQIAAWSAAGPGLVAGDRVNLAARVQSEAEPGGVLVDDPTMRATHVDLSYADAGQRLLKGFSEPVALWRALRVLAPTGGVRRVDALEASFIGRARELGLVKELFHATAQDGRARLVAVSGVAGIGKSRLSWEFESYVEGLVDEVFWHRGRCLSYGDGVAFWALTEMVRQRFDIASDDAADVAAAKLSEGLPAWVSDAQERDFVEPRLAVLVGAGEREFSQEELFAGWRLFLERLAALRPVVLVFEDLHWADTGLVDFLEYLLDWASAQPLYLLTLSRPELAEGRQGYATDRLGATVLHLEPLPAPAMSQLIEELVPGVPEALRDTITAKSGGIPLYAVETVRSLVDQGLVERRSGTLRLVGEVDNLAVPASLTAVIAARLDALPPTERELVLGLAVLGDTFPRGAIRAVSDVPESLVNDYLRALVRKEFLAVRSDPLAPERNVYDFLQPMVRSVAYDALSRKERKLRHRGVADHLRAAFSEDGIDVSEVIADHLLKAYQASENDSDAPHLRAETAEAFDRAGARASAIGSPDSAESYYRRAASLTEDEAEQARYVASAAIMADRAGRPLEALSLFDSATDAHRAGGRSVDAARVVAWSGWARLNSVASDPAVTLQLLKDAADELERAGVLDELATLHAMVGSALMGLDSPDPEAAAEQIERGLVLSAAIDDVDGLSAGMHTRAEMLARQHRVVEAAALYSAVVDYAHGNDDLEMEAIARGNFGRLLANADLHGAAAALQKSVELSNRLGAVLLESETTHGLGLLHYFLGDWDEAERCARRAIEVSQRAPLPDGRLLMVLLQAARGEPDEAERHLDALEEVPTGSDRDDAVDLGRALMALVARDPGEAAERAGRVASQALRTKGRFSSLFRLAWPLAVESALAAGDRDETRPLLALVEDAPIGHVPPYLRAQLARLLALLAATGDGEGTEKGLRSSILTFGDLGYAYWRARAQSDLAGWLNDQGRVEEAAPLLAEAADVFRRVGAAPDLGRLEALRSPIGT
jgi:class 3 adenylate cyclase/tetratricopeptide (TPR) repeat protein